MFCHEWPWHKVDRIWTMWTDGTAVTKIHTRTMAMEILGHEFWSPDGKTLWYDLQTPRGRDFWLASYRLDSASCSAATAVTRGQVARATDGQWSTCSAGRAFGHHVAVFRSNMFAGEVARAHQ